MRKVRLKETEQTPQGGADGQHLGDLLDPLKVLTHRAAEGFEGRTSLRHELPVWAVTTLRCQSQGRRSLEEGKGAVAQGVLKNLGTSCPQGQTNSRGPGCPRESRAAVRAPPRGHVRRSTSHPIGPHPPGNGGNRGFPFRENGAKNAEAWCLPFTICFTHAPSPALLSQPCWVSL